MNRLIEITLTLIINSGVKYNLDFKKLMHTVYICAYQLRVPERKKTMVTSFVVLNQSEPFPSHVAAH